MDVTQVPIRAARDGSELCLECGLCCDGIMFSEISVRPHEREYVESLGLPVTAGLDGSGITVFQPCPAFAEGCCSLYEVGRPATCHTYACGLLRGFESDRATFEDALAVIQQARTLAHELEVAMSMPLGTYNRRALQEYLRERRPWEMPSLYPRFLAALYEFTLLGNKYFEFNPAEVETRAADAGAEVAAESARARD